MILVVTEALFLTYRRESKTVLDRSAGRCTEDYYYCNGIVSNVTVVLIIPCCISGLHVTSVQGTNRSGAAGTHTKSQ